jgi:hypothetical protein
MAKGAVVTTYSLTANVVVTNSTVETSASGPGAGSLLLPPRFLEPGSSLRVLLKGVYSTGNVSTIQWRVKLGATVVLDSGLGVIPTRETNMAVEMESLIVCRTVGAPGSVMASGALRYHAASAGAMGDYPPQTAPVPIDTTRPQRLDVTLQFGQADPKNIVTVTQFLVWAEQPV